MKKAQAWGFDLMIAASIFLFGIAVFFLYSLNYPRGEQEKISDLLYEGNSIADDLMSTGTPEHWVPQTATKIGISTDNKINQTKLEQLYQLATTEYGRTRALFSTKYHYFINASAPLAIADINISGIGNQPFNPLNNIKVTRITIYQNKPITLEVYVWE